MSRLALPLAMASAAPALGCSGTATTTEPVASAQQATTRAPVAVAAHGFVRLAGDALGDVPLTASQRAAVEQLAVDAEARHAAAVAARHELAATLAAQVQAGQVDRAALKPGFDALASALRAAQPADRAAIEQLHAILTPEQRVAFVNAFRARLGDKATGLRGHHPLRQWAQDLRLTPDQVAQIRGGLAQAFEPTHGRRGGDGGADDPLLHARARGKAVLDAFEQDRFVLGEVAPAEDPAAKAAKTGDRELAFVESVLPVLTPDQRAMAAQKIREHAEATDDASPSVP